MRYFLDCEFNGYRGELISMALAADDGAELYLARPRLRKLDPWVEKNVEPIVTLDDACPEVCEVFSSRIQAFLTGDPFPVIIADWPDDIRYFCECLITGPGQMVKSGPVIQFEVRRVDAYPSQLAGAVQHNALWDARALRALFIKPKGANRRLPPGVHCP